MGYLSLCPGDLINVLTLLLHVNVLATMQQVLLTKWREGREVGEEGREGESGRGRKRGRKVDEIVNDLGALCAHESCPQQQPLL